MDKQKVLQKLDAAWLAFKESYAGLSEAQMTAPGAVGAWSVKDILGHVSAWEAEGLKYLPLILAGGRPPRYKDLYGGLDAFNAQMVAQQRNLTLAAILAQLDETHRQLVAYLQSAPDEVFTHETRFRRRLRLDTYSHYPLHTQAIRAWRERGH